MATVDQPLVIQAPTTPELPVQRTQQQALIREACATSEHWSGLDVIKQSAIVRKIERDCFAAAIESCKIAGIDRLFTDKRFRARYATECYRVIYNLDVTKVGHDYLLKNILDGKIDPDYITKNSSYDLCPMASQAERDIITLRQSVRIEEKVSHEYRCNKCGKNETTYLKYQARATDEDDTLSIKCLSCGNVWRR